MIPFNTTTITISRRQATVDEDPYDSPPPGPTIIAADVRAVIGTPSGAPQLVGGDRVVFSASLTCDICDLQKEDTVIEADGTTWTCLWARPMIAIGVDHMIGSLRSVRGNT